MTGLIWLVVFQLLGEVVVRLADLPVPGPVMGMALLFVALQVRRPPPTSRVFAAADGLLRHFQLLFVPAGVGVIASWALIRDNAAALVVGLLASWLVGLVLAGWMGQAFGRHASLSEGGRSHG